MNARHRWMLVVGGLAWVGLFGRAYECAFAQSNKTSKRAATAAEVRFEHLHDIPYKGVELPVTMIHDEVNRPYLYVASKEAGLRIYDVKDAPRLAREIPIADLASLQVMSVSQSGKRIFLALGNHFSKGVPAGLAVIDVNHPEKRPSLESGRTRNPRAAAGPCWSTRTPRIWRRWGTV
jgi:hypothetical protein